MKKVLYGVGSALLMVVLGLAVFMLFLVVPEREMLEEDTVVVAAASVKSDAADAESPPETLPSAVHNDQHARRNEDGEQGTTSTAASTQTRSSGASSTGDSAEKSSDPATTRQTDGGADSRTGASDSGETERDAAAGSGTGTGASAADTGQSDGQSVTRHLTEDTGASASTQERPNETVATRERTTAGTEQTEAGEDRQQEEQGGVREERTPTVVDNPTPAPEPQQQPAGQTVQLGTGNYADYLSVSVADFGGGSYEARTAPVGGGTFSNAAVSVTVRLTINVISDVRTVNGIEGAPAGNGQYTHTLTEETRVTLYPDASGYATTGSYWSIDRNDRLTVTGLSVSLAGVSSVSGSVTR
ncbi:MAG: hypothetical protein IJP92_03020 [Lachnospiraceae bacterium]|nr:hypothetical protein [Lachnospiraceae bacterium]